MSCTIPVKRKRVSVPPNRKQRIEWKAEQANGATDYLIFLSLAHVKRN